MSLARDEVLELAAAHRLDAARTHALFTLAGFDAPPAPPAARLQRWLAALAALLAGLGVIFLVAANWHEIGRYARFAGSGAVVLLSGGAAFRYAGPLRAPLALLCLLASGALFALLGQTYQTGADAWQLFALWAALTLPLAVGARSDLVWSGWAIVACAAVALWLGVWLRQSWFDSGLLAPHLLAWALNGAIVALLWPPLAQWTGAARWSGRIAALLAIALVATTALVGLFESHVHPVYPLGLVALAAASWPFLRRGGFDLPVLAMLALALDVLIVCGVGRALLDRGQLDRSGYTPTAEFLTLGIVAAGVLAASVTALMRARHRAGASDE